MDKKKPKLLRVVVGLLFRLVGLIYHGLLSIVHGGPGEKIPPIDNLILLDSATALAHKIRNKKLTSLEVVQSFIKRIEETNKYVNAVVSQRYKEALEEAKKADEFVKTSGKSSAEIANELPFLGVPFTVKSSIPVRELCHASGVYHRKDLIAEEDAEVVALLRKAGGIPIASTNVPELCLSWECYNTIYGRTNNPYNTNCNPGGSSGGEAAILALGGSAMGLGSDIGGSIRMPAFFCGIFGHKGSSGTVSWKGHFPLPDSEENRSFLSIGPMSRFACDLLPIMKVISTPTSRHLLKLDQKVDVSKLNFYYAEDDGGGYLVTPVESEIKDAIRKVVLFMKKTYGITAKKIEYPSLRKSARLWFSKMSQKSSQLRRDIGSNEVEVNPVMEIIKLPFGLSKHIFPIITVAVLEQFFNDFGSAKQKHGVALCDELRADFEELLGTNGVFIYPTMPTAAQYHYEAQAKFLNFGYSGIFNVLGLPATQCPMGLNRDGLPIGLQIIAAHNQDRLTLAVAKELEKAFGGWVPPSSSES